MTHGCIYPFKTQSHFCLPVCTISNPLSLRLCYSFSLLLFIFLLSHLYSWLGRPSLSLTFTVVFSVGGVLFVRHSSYIGVAKYLEKHVSSLLLSSTV